MALGDGGSVLDPAGNPADLTLPTPGSTPDGLYAQHIEIVTTPATVTAVSSTARSVQGGTDRPDHGGFQPFGQRDGRYAAIGPERWRHRQLRHRQRHNDAHFQLRCRGGHNTDDLDYASTGALTLNGATITDNLNNIANLTLPATGTDGLATQNIVIEGAAPTVTAVSTTKSAGTYGAGTTIPITVTFSHPVTVTGTPQLTLNDRRGGRLQQRQRIGDSHFQLRSRSGTEHVRPGLRHDWRWGSMAALSRTRRATSLC